MWKRDEAVRPPSPQPAAPAPAPQQPAMAPAGSRADAGHFSERDNNVNIGKSIVIKGELTGSEDLTIEGQVEGTIQLRDHVLTIGPNGKIKAQIFAKSVIVLGEVNGNVTASEKVDIRDKGSVDGDIAAPRVAIADGAHFRGSIDMQSKGAPKTEVKPTSPAAPSRLRSKAADPIKSEATAYSQNGYEYEPDTLNSPVPPGLFSPVLRQARSFLLPRRASQVLRPAHV